MDNYYNNILQVNIEVKTAVLNVIRLLFFYRLLLATSPLKMKGGGDLCQRRLQQ